MPTTRPRHMITETPAVASALAALRAKLGGARVDFAELVVLGARAKARQLPDPDAESRRAAAEIAEMIRTGFDAEVDVHAADEVKRLGLIALDP